MIALCSADVPADPAVLRSPGGFSWFYVDLVDARGHGATLIWSWGLPFLPGYAGAARAGRPATPLQRPSVNLVVYGDGGERFYLLSEFPAEQCQWAPDGRSWRLGDCSFRWIDTPGVAGAAPTRTLQADLDLALPTGGRATGRLWLTGSLRRDPAGTAAVAAPTGAACSHQWTPMIAAACGGLELHTPSGTLTVEGRGYHDRNSATHPLHALGIRSWWWGRLALPGRDLVLYRLTPSGPGSTPHNIVVELAADGACRVREDARVTVGRMRRSLWGMRWPSTLSFTDPDGVPVWVEVDALLDNGPFYHRYLLTGRCGSEQGYGLGESVVPDRIDTDLLRPLVRMRVHRTEGVNSMWLPLFCGDAEGRWGRLMGRSGTVRT